jgi:hypothetical protein
MIIKTILTTILILTIFSCVNPINPDDEKTKKINIISADDTLSVLNKYELDSGIYLEDSIRTTNKQFEYHYNTGIFSLTVYKVIAGTTNLVYHKHNILENNITLNL